jgi:hypothetical protein
MKPIYWLHVPQEESMQNREIFEKLFETVNNFHEAGKDVLFVPVKKGYSNPEDVKKGFLKSLDITPGNEGEQLSKMSKIEIKRMYK